MIMNISRLFFALIFCAGCLVLSSRGQSTESIRIPTSGDNCNVVNLNFGRGEENVEQARGPQGPPGKRGSPGLPGLKGERGPNGVMGPRGIAPEINVADITTAVMKALGSSSCGELMRIHGISETGYYWMKSNETQKPVYNYCDFETREGVNDCEQLGERLGEDMKDGYYIVGSSSVHCTKEPPENCNSVSREDAKRTNISGGVFDIRSASLDKTVEVYCDLETDGGGWTLFQRRFDGSVDFYRNWDDYVNGFGEKDKEFWLGLETIHQMTKDGNYELRVDLTDFNGNTAYAKYGTFSVASSDDNYRLNFGTYSGTAGDSLASEHNNKQFSTKDADNNEASRDCSLEYKGGWWYGNCHHSNLNGLYNQGDGIGATGVSWYHWKNDYHYLKFTEMKFRKKE